MSTLRPDIYPEHAKRDRMTAALGLDHVRAFLHWFINEREPNGFLGDSETECMIRQTSDELLREYAGLDERKLEAERRAMLDAAQWAAK